MSEATASPPLLELNGARANIRLNRPKHLNRLQADDLDVLLKLFDRIEADPAIRVLVLTGTGRAFSAGYDLNSVAERAVRAVEERSAGSAFEVVVNRLEDIGVPTICRLNGGVYGGSTDLALACDFRIGVDACEMFMPAARLGLHYYKSGIARYVARLGVDNAKKLFLTAQKIGAAEMLRIGYLTAVVPAEALDEEVDRLAAILAGNAPMAMRGMKRTINEFARGKLDEDAADRRHRESMRGDEIREGIRRFRKSARRSFDWSVVAFPGRCAARSGALLNRGPYRSKAGSHGSRLCGAARRALHRVRDTKTKPHCACACGRSADLPNRRESPASARWHWRGGSTCGSRTPR